MLLFPNCKINIGLQITSKRADGFHNLQTIFYPAKWHDAVEILSAPGSEETTLTTSGLRIDSDPTKNLCYQAWAILKEAFPQLPAVRIFLHKAIPMGAGLGGGSADAAFVLKALNQKFSLGLSNTDLMDVAARLGSDCSFFIHNNAAFAEGRGEVLQPLPINLNGYSCFIVFPALSINTAWAFSKMSPAEPTHDLRWAVTQPVDEWKNYIVNDFEAVVSKQFPEIAAIEEQLYLSGAVYASLSGSGSAVYGIFKGEDVDVPTFPDHYLTKFFSF